MRTTLNKRNVEALRPADASWIAWDNRLTGVRTHPVGTKTFIVNYRAGDGGRKGLYQRLSFETHFGDSQGERVLTQWRSCDWRFGMRAGIPLREDYDAAQLRALAETVRRAVAFWRLG